MLICRIRSYYLSKKVDEGSGKIILKEPFLDVKVVKKKGAKIILNGNLVINTHLSGTTSVRIILKEFSTLKIEGKFTIGNGTKLYVGENASLEIGGMFNESNSGITADTIIMVNRHIKIGIDFLCAWNVYITDSDWHLIDNKPHQKDVIIGNHVWIANSANILKGSLIGDGCIVASFSKLINKNYESNVLIAGLEGKVIKENVCWSRDIS